MNGNSTSALSERTAVSCKLLCELQEVSGVETQNTGFHYLINAQSGFTVRESDKTKKRCLKIAVRTITTFVLK